MRENAGICDEDTRRRGGRQAGVVIGCLEAKQRASPAAATITTTRGRYRACAWAWMHGMPGRGHAHSLVACMLGRAPRSQKKQKMMEEDLAPDESSEAKKPFGNAHVPPSYSKEPTHIPITTHI